MLKQTQLLRVKPIPNVPVCTLSTLRVKPNWRTYLAPRDLLLGRPYRVGGRGHRRGQGGTFLFQDEVLGRFISSSRVVSCGLTWKVSVGYKLVLEQFLVFQLEQFLAADPFGRSENSESSAAWTPCCSAVPELVTHELKYISASIR